MWHLPQVSGVRAWAAENFCMFTGDEEAWRDFDSRVRRELRKIRKGEVETRYPAVTENDV